MLKIENLVKSFQMGNIETRALDGINLHIKEGEFIAIIGPSGAGKSTLLNIMGLLENFDQGSLSIAGQSVTHLNDKQLSKLRSEKLGFIFQSFNLLPELSIEQNVMLPMEFRQLKKDDIRQRCQFALESVGLLGRAKHKPAQLSGGQQQRAAIARALAGNPKLLLADEPTGNLNSSMAKEVMEILKASNAAGTTIIMVTHDMKLAAQASRIIEINDGKLIQRKHPSLEENTEESLLCE